MKKYHYKNTIKVPKSANFVPFIKNLAWEIGIKLEIDMDETGWLMKTQHIRFIVTGEESEITMFVNRLHASVDDYQQRTTSICGL